MTKSTIAFLIMFFIPITFGLYVKFDVIQASLIILFGLAIYILISLKFKKL